MVDQQTADWINTWWTPEHQLAQQQQLEGQIAQRALAEGWTRNGDQWIPPGGLGTTPPDVTGQTPDAPMPIPTDPAGDSAVGAIRASLGQYGLAGLGDTIWGWWKAGVPIEQILLDMRNTSEYKARFPAMEALAQKGRALSEQEYIEYERGVSNLFHQYGIPTGFYDSPSDFSNFLINDLSLSEIAERVQLAADRVYSASTIERQQMQLLYGVDDGHMISFMLDPAKAQPFLQRAVNAVKASGAWANSELGQLTLAEAERLAALDPGQAAQSIGKLGALRELFNPLDFGEQAIVRSQQLGAITGDVSDQEDINRRGERRKARFEGGGQFVTNREGLTV
jgi:hypothetical protein